MTEDTPSNDTAPPALKCMSPEIAVSGGSEEAKPENTSEEHMDSSANLFTNIAESTPPMPDLVEGQDYDVSSDSEIVQTGRGRKKVSKKKSPSDKKKTSAGRGRGRGKGKKRKDKFQDYSSEDENVGGRLGETLRKARAAAKEAKQSKSTRERRLVGPYLLPEKTGGEEVVDKMMNYRIINPVPSRLDGGVEGDVGGVGTAVKPQVPGPPQSAPHGGLSPFTAWCCVFCGKRSTFLELGPLYGPYYLPQEACKELPEECLFPVDKDTETGRVVSDTGEFWCHLECALWAPGTAFDGLKITGWSEAVPLALRTSCSHCAQPGAVIGCSERGCQQAYHYLCVSAVEGVCLDEDTFCMLCQDHRKT